MKHSAKNLFLSVLGSGFLPKMPGTYGSLVGLLLCMAIYLVISEVWSSWIFSSVLIFLATTLFSISIPLINEIEKQHGLHDPSWIVIDELVGMMIALLLPWLWQSWWLPVIVFGLFRLFDIWKPFPISIVDDKKGGVYVMLDDIIAGIMAAVVGMCILYLSRLYDLIMLTYLLEMVPKVQ